MKLVIHRDEVGGINEIQLELFLNYFTHQNVLMKRMESLTSSSFSVIFKNDFNKKEKQRMKNILRS